MGELPTSRWYNRAHKREGSRSYVGDDMHVGGNVRVGDNVRVGGNVHTPCMPYASGPELPS